VFIAAAQAQQNVIRKRPAFLRDVFEDGLLRRENETEGAAAIDDASGVRPEPVIIRTGGAG
jgi:hypothetical protein